MHIRPLKHLEERFDWYGAVIEDDPTALKGRWALTNAAKRGRTAFEGVCLDLGCGKGAFTVEAARQNPQLLFVGMDCERRCLAQAAQLGCESGLDNVVFVVADAVELESIFGPEELTCLYLNFPTPFPRTRNAELRLTEAGHLLSYRKLLAPGASLRFKTDSLPLYRYSLIQFELAGYELLWQTEDMVNERPDGIDTEYQLRLTAQGAKVCALEAIPCGEAPTDWKQTAPLSLMEYYHPDELENLTYVPLGMEGAVENFRNKRRNIEALQAQQTSYDLCALNTAFYQQNASTFSDTRQAPWQGWNQLLQVLENQDAQITSVLDLGCGNMRFEEFLAERGNGLSAAELNTDETPFQFYGVDNCQQLAQTGQDKIRVAFQQLDIMGTLVSERPISYYLDAPCCDLTVAFGVMHHVPLPAMRQQLVRSMIEHTKAGGYVALSLWRFLDDPKLEEKARRDHARALEHPDFADLAQRAQALGPRDILMGWQQTTDSFRYCHGFSEEEIDELVDIATAQGKAELIARYGADGHSGKLNTYLVFRVLNS